MGVKTDNMVFVFGSNLGGIHGAGAAAFARMHRGAQMGHGVGRTGQTYAIPTKGVSTTGGQVRVGGTLPLETINVFVQEFLDFARLNPQLQFQVTRLGCGLAGLKDWDVAPMFDNAPSNCWFDEAWRGHSGLMLANFWGTFNGGL